MWIEELPNGKYKYVERYEDKNGKERRVSVTHEKKTKRVQAEMYLYLQERIEEKMNALEKTTLEEIIEDFKAVHYQTVKKSTSYGYNSALRDIVAYFGASTDVNTITRSDVNRFILHLLNTRKLKRSTVQHKLNALRLVIRHGLTYGHIDENITNYIVIPKINLPDDNDWKFLEKDELNYILNELYNSHQTVAIISELLALTGMRYGELVSIDYEKHIDFKNKTLLIERTYLQKLKLYNTPKNGKSRTIHLNDHSISLIKKQIKSSKLTSLKHGYRTTLLFPNQIGNPFTYSNYMHHLKQVEFHKNLSSHIFRHTFITRMVENNIPPLIIAEHVGHTGTQMVEQVYTHFSNKLNEHSRDMINNIQIL